MWHTVPLECHSVMHIVIGVPFCGTLLVMSKGKFHPRKLHKAYRGEEV